MRRLIISKLKRMLSPFYWAFKFTLKDRKRGLRMSPLYADHMILQGGTPLKIAGRSYVADWVTVRICGQEQQTCCDSDGMWEVRLGTLYSGGPYSLEITTAKQRLFYTDVYVGEVWLCSGQSNMVVSLSSHLNVCSEEKTARMYQENDMPFRHYCIKPIYPTYPGRWGFGVNRLINHYWYACFFGWRNCNGSDLLDLSAVAYYYGEMLSRHLQIPVGLIVNPVGGTAEYCWIERRVLQRELPEILKDWHKNRKVTAWMKDRVIENLGQCVSEQVQMHPYHPGYCHETFVRPIKDYMIRGVIWFSGESSAQLEDIEFFGQQQQLLVKSWRESRGECFPFYYVQLHGYRYEDTLGKALSYNYPQLREKQRSLLEEIPNSGMAVSYDLSVPGSVHFRRRKPLGERLARLALHYTYGLQDVVPSGPLSREATLRGNRIYIRFDFAMGLRTSDGEPVHTFEVAGSDRCFYPAEAWIMNDEIILSCPEVLFPCWVHYAFESYPRLANLVNGEGLPAATFEVEIR